MIRRSFVVVPLVALVLVASGSTVSAHIDPDPKQAQAGSRLTVGFTVEHGCDGSPTVQLDMRLPEGVVDPVAEPVAEPLDDWIGSVDDTPDGTIVSFVGGTLADDVEGTFEVTMTLPPTPDTTIYFPFVQRCEEGEIRWIGIPSEPGDELDEPAPAMALTGPVATVPTTAAPTTVAPPATAPVTTAPSITAPAATAPVTAAADSTVPASSVPATGDSVVVGTGTGSSGGSNTGSIAFAITIAVMVIGGAIVVIRTRRSRTVGTPEASSGPTGATPGDAS